MKHAEEYYRTMVRGGPGSWNIRDRHMVETLERLMRHHGAGAKAIIWEHNTHVGDARFTDMEGAGMVNVGQLVRCAHAPEATFIAGFGFEGSVIAGNEWEAPMQRMTVPPAHTGSWEHLLHEAGADDKLLLSSEIGKTDSALEPRGHRAIGVVYHPDYEAGNYVRSVLPKRYDAFLDLDTTHALHPLHEVQPSEKGEVPETFPTGV